MIFASTCKVYSNWLNNLKIRELPTRYEWLSKKGISEKNPIDLNGDKRGIYGLSKYLAEEIIKEYFFKAKISVIINRLSGIYGLINREQNPMGGCGIL